MPSAADRIRQARQRAGLTQAELARRARTSQPTVAAYESGSKAPAEDTLRRLLDAAAVRPSDLLQSHRSAVIDLARQFGADNVRVFGSVARREDNPGSDIDFLVAFRPGTTMLAVAGLADALEALLGVKVDLVSQGGLEPGHRIGREAVPL